MFRFDAPIVELGKQETKRTLSGNILSCYITNSHVLETNQSVHI